MGQKPPWGEERNPAAGDGPVAPEPENKLAAGIEPASRVIGDKPAASAPPDDDEEDDDELELDDDEDDEDLVVFTAKEAAGALATIYAFVKPILRNYKKILTFVAFCIDAETLCNVIIPLSLKFLIS